MLVTSTAHEVLALAPLYRDRADAENNFDELQNQWGWRGFTTQDLARCRLMARMVALVYNWGTLYVRLAHPHQHFEAISSRQARLRRATSALPFQRLPGSAFTLVESLGLAYLGKIIRRSLPTTADGAMSDRIALTPAQARQLRPQLVMPDAQVSGERVALATSVLRAMSLTAGFARLVLLVGDGSQSANNPHAAGLDCGACGGQTGEVNVRALAGLLNDVAVRNALCEQSIPIPATTHWQTVTDGAIE